MDKKLKAEQRRQVILEQLKERSQPISASKLAATLGVSRQIIVGDVALLRANGQDILSTPRGYIFSQALPLSQYIGKVVCHHSREETAQELAVIIEEEAILVDVEIEHPVYGMLTAPLNISKKTDVDYFLSKLEVSQAELLSTLTQGVHLHTLSCRDEAHFEAVKSRLEEEGFLYKD
ncbi:transcription repressor NadR [Streptococcus saliviloxodontae]|uniref:Transcriptional regulator of NAD metabolism n=1 Tax=Streptococcus saliviloxodontae TaxID=1349416 RepID=A0ABS2PMW3_9STRE|nr:transcription repressor NadR [Streptococcus saliviloxodontae]MBM7636689.1 transcriptional regulator of NAD metabolism [Streptococcus saliviloxodontae]